ncbi:unnamed protein product [Chondrus crispus]|uniref:BZIP domain-containing protein n=1 Tax=Chondrus crispus TaxID=2769 RepID=R7QFD4_CHOCR|nr:unnamed protein product [Chondrus crispus]CDF36125.1 unnamed protein product [Chondrus crispus]|eukprot:XP_005715944.1 unnamed protein product [Chondrus crispus]
MFSGSKLRKRDRRMLMSFATSCTCTCPPSPCRATERRACRLTNFSTHPRDAVNFDWGFWLATRSNAGAVALMIRTVRSAMPNCRITAVVRYPLSSRSAISCFCDMVRRLRVAFVFSGTGAITTTIPPLYAESNQVRNTVRKELVSVLKDAPSAWHVPTLSTMPVTLPPPPTFQELLSLCSHIPRQPPPSPSTAHLLAPFVDICNEPWIHDFLFTPDAIELSHFASPILSSTAYLCSISQTAVTRAALLPDPFLTSLHDSRMFGHYLFVPAFHAHGATVGFGIMDSAFQNHDFRKLCPSATIRDRFMTFRFVRDTKRKLLLEVFDLPEHGIVVTFIFQYLTSMTSRSFTAVFLREPFFRAANDRTKPFSAEAVIPALLVLKNDTQYRLCPFCGQKKLPPCKCIRPRFSPAHPFDTGSFSYHMTLQQGVYTGFSKKAMFWQASQSHDITLGNRYVLEPFLDTSIVFRLSSDAIKVILMRLSNNPRMSLVSNSLSAARDVQVVSTMPQLLDTNLGNDALENLECLDPDASASQNRHGSLVQSHEHDSLSPICADEICLTKASGSDPDPFTSLFCDRVSPSQECYRLSPTLMKKRCTTQESRSDRHLQRMNGFESTSIVSCISTERGGKSNLLAPRPKVVFVSRKESSLAPTGRKNGVKTTTVPDLAERRKRAIERRERNRAAARRSNQRIREHREGLLAEIQALKEKAEELRVREVSLRQENLQLRRNAGGVGLLLVRSSYITYSEGVRNGHMYSEDTMSFYVVITI